MKFKYLIYTLATSLALLNCADDSTDDLQAEMTPETEIDPGMNSGIITYNSDIKNIISTYCAQCHGSTPTNGTSLPLSTFNEVSSRITRVIARTNSESNPMPASGLIPLELRNKIKKWQEDGLLEN